MDHMSAEKWAPIAGYEGHYEVSDHGNVRSLDRVVKTSRGTRRVQGKTHCPQGHPYDKANTKIIPSRPNARYCRACHRERYLTGKAEP